MPLRKTFDELFTALRWLLPSTLRSVILIPCAGTLALAALLAVRTPPALLYLFLTLLLAWSYFRDIHPEPDRESWYPETPEESPHASHAAGEPGDDPRHLLFAALACALSACLAFVLHEVPARWPALLISLLPLPFLLPRLRRMLTLSWNAGPRADHATGTVVTQSNRRNRPPIPCLVLWATPFLLPASAALLLVPGTVDLNLTLRLAETAQLAGILAALGLAALARHEGVRPALWPLAADKLINTLLIPWWLLHPDSLLPGLDHASAPSALRVSLALCFLLLGEWESLSMVEIWRRRFPPSEAGSESQV